MGGWRMIQATMPKPVARELRERRVLAALSRRRLSEMAGVDPSTIYRAEKGLSVPDSDTLARLDHALNAAGAILQSAGVTSPDTSPPETRRPGGGDEMTDGFLERALKTVPIDLRAEAEVAAIEAVLQAIRPFRQGAAGTREHGAQ